jgi:hypothetical protein
MRTTTLTWQQAWWLCAVLGAVVLLARLLMPRFVPAPPRRLRFVLPATTEIAVLAGLDGLWIRAGGPTAADPNGGFDRARWLVRIERDLYIPREQDLVNALAPHELLSRAANLYYASMHFTVMLILLAWLFLRHRDKYKDIRTWMVMFTGLALIVQLVPVAPPRLMPELGFVDLAKLYGQSVYGGIGNFQPAQFGAMPSVHVGWAILTGYAVWRISPSRWRWIAPAHAVLMCLVVVATANHWWADGIVSAMLLLIARAIQLAVRAVFRRTRARRSESRDGAAGSGPSDQPDQLTAPGSPGALEPAR